MNFTMREIELQQTLEPTVDWIDGHLSEKITTSLLADRAGMSRAHFCREWKACTGAPPLVFVRHRRTLAALSKIVRTQDKLVNIAADCGFASHAHMTEVVRAITSLAPSDIRANWPAVEPYVRRQFCQSLGLGPAETAPPEFARWWHR